MDYEASITIDDDVVRDYIKDNFDVDDVFDENEIKNYISRNFMPEDVFDDDTLTAWAIDHGFVKESTE